MSDGQFFHESITLEQPTLFKSLLKEKVVCNLFTELLLMLCIGMIILLFVKSRKFVLKTTQNNGIKILLAFVLFNFF